MATISFTPVVFANGKRADGSYNVKIRVYYKGKDRKLATTLTAYPEDLTKKLTIKSQSLKEKCSDLVRQLRKPLENLTFSQLEEMDVDDLVNYIKESQRGFNLDFFEFAEKSLSRRKVSTARVMRPTLNEFAAFLGKRQLNITQINSAMLRGFQAWMEAKHGKQKRCTNAYLNTIRIFMHEARVEYNDEEHQRVPNPFAYYTIPQSAAPKHRNLSVDVFRTMMNERKNLSGQERTAVDVFLISFFLCGMNLPDLMECERAKDGIITFNRSKTRDTRTDRAEGKVRIEPEVRELIDEYADDVRQFRFYKMYSGRFTFNTCVDKGLRTWADKHDFGKITYYMARHSVASISYQLGTPREVINDMLTHVDKSMKMTDIYINKDWSRVWEANRKMILFVLGESE